MSSKANSQLIKNTALEFGFDQCGICKVTKLETEAHRLETWLSKGYHGEMSYMERYFDLRIDPQQFLPGAKSILMMSLNYFPEQTPEVPKISRYAFGQDYHDVIRQKTKAFLTELKSLFGEIAVRAFVDSAPVLERVWAEKSGLGWNGKHSLNIHPRKGSWYFLCGIITDLEFDQYDDPMRDHCGTCRRCIEACPTEAIAQEGYLLDASKCISYLTIELKNQIPQEFHDKMKGWMFGCDICQEVCPWNRFAKVHSTPEFENKNLMDDKSNFEWLNMTDEVWNKISYKSPLKRAGKEKILSNIRIAFEGTDIEKGN